MIRIINPVRRYLPSIFEKGQGRLWPRASPILRAPKDEKEQLIDGMHKKRSLILALCGATALSATELFGPHSAEASYLTWSDKLIYLLTSTAARRSVFDRLSDHPSILDFKANAGTGSDDTAAFAAAITYMNSKGGGRLYLPGSNASAGGRTYRNNTSLVPTQPIQFIGDGMSYQAFGMQPASLITTLLWTGVADGYMFNFTNVNYGSGVSNLTINCATVGNGIYMDTTVGSRVQQLMCIDFKTFGLRMAGTFQTCSWNHFEQTSWESLVSTENISIDRVLGAANTAHCSFLQTKIVHAGASEGIHFGNPDNICFTMTFIYAAPGYINYGIRIDPAVQAGFPGELTFFHLETQSGWFQPNTTIGPPAIVTAMNQSPNPTLNGTKLTYLKGDGTAWLFA